MTGLLPSPHPFIPLHSSTLPLYSFHCPQHTFFTLSASINCLTRPLSSLLHEAAARHFFSHLRIMYTFTRLHPSLYPSLPITVYLPSLHPSVPSHDLNPPSCPTLLHGSSFVIFARLPSLTQPLPFLLPCTASQHPSFVIFTTLSS